MFTGINYESIGYSISMYHNIGRINKCIEPILGIILYPNCYGPQLFFVTCRSYTIVIFSSIGLPHEFVEFRVDVYLLIRLSD